MSTQRPTSATPRKRTLRWWLIGAAAFAALVGLLVVANVAAFENAARVAEAGATETPEATPVPSGRPTTSPSEGPSPAPTRTPTVATGVPTVEPSSGEPAPPAALPPVSLSDEAAPLPGVVFTIGALEAVEGEAQGPGEVGGPAIRFSLTVRNDTSSTASLESTVVNVYSGADEAPASELQGPGARALPAEVAAGATATGFFVYSVPAERRDRVQIAVDYSAGVPIVLFEGSVPR